MKGNFILVYKTISVFIFYESVVDDIGEKRVIYALICLIVFSLLYVIQIKMYVVVLLSTHYVIHIRIYVVKFFSTFGNYKVTKKIFCK